MKKISKKIIFYILGLAVLIIGYLFLAHFLIYFRIGHSGLVSSDSQYVYMIGNSATTSNSLVYGALGDSLTSGVGVEKYEESYPYLVALKLSQQKNTQVDLKTFSYPGARTSDLIKNLLDPAITAKPEVITLLIGINDIHGNVGLETFRKNYEYILERLTKETQAKIYLIGLPSLGADGLLLPPYNYYFEQQTQSYNKIIKSLAEKYSLSFIDLNKATLAESKKNNGYYSKDLFHPSADGYRLWAQIIYDNFNK
jgi:lysophospholipase L1-like esterase